MGGMSLTWDEMLGPRFNAFKPVYNGWCFTDDISNAFSWMIFLFIVIEISLQFSPQGLIGDKPTLCWTMAWCR